jgi:hypothetical protein
MNVTECNECGAETPTSKAKNGNCYGCWVGVGSSGPTIQWRGGGGYSKEDFHERTNKEFMSFNDIEDSQPY